MRPPPYTGMTGFKSRSQVDAVHTALGGQCLLMVGVGVCGSPLQEKHSGCPDRYPNASELGTIFRSYSNVLNLLHLHDHDHSKLLEHILVAQDLAGPNCHGIQLNQCQISQSLPDVDLLAKYKATGRTGRTIVLPCDRSALDMVGWNPVKLARRLKVYESLVEYIIMDFSGGKGEELDTSLAHECFREIAQLMPNVGFVVSGGLCADNVAAKISPLREFDPGTDAEGKIHTNGRFDVAKAIRYGLATIEAKRVQQPVN